MHDPTAESERKIYDFFKVSNGQYCVPTEDDSKKILEVIDQTPVAASLSVYNDQGLLHGEQKKSLLGIVDVLLATGSNRVTDIAEHFRQIGFYVPSEEDIWAFQEARDPYTRATIMQKLNEERFAVERKWERTHGESRDSEVVI